MQFAAPEKIALLWKGETNTSFSFGNNHAPIHVWFAVMSYLKRYNLSLGDVSSV